MAENLYYALSGKRGITSDRSWFLVSQLKKAGVVFPHHPKFGIVNGQLIFHPIHEISDKIRESAIMLIKGEGVKDAKIEVVAKCLSTGAKF
ncbi:MAG: hypothetical protein V1801_00680 [Candidatus Falkowbacteria bacterium]